MLTKVSPSLKRASVSHLRRIGGIHLSLIARLSRSYQLRHLLILVYRSSKVFIHLAGLIFKSSGRYFAVMILSVESALANRYCIILLTGDVQFAGYGWRSRDERVQRLFRDSLRSARG